MEYFMIEKDGRTFKVILWPDGFQSYDFSIYEIVQKKHWWSKGKVYLTRGTAWKHIEEEVLEKLEQYLQRERRIKNLATEFDDLKNKHITFNTTTEQKRLLCDIAHWHIKEFYNRMSDHWDDINYAVNAECTNNVRKLEKIYFATYGRLPQWENIDIVTNTLENLQNDLKQVSMEEIDDCLAWSVVTYGDVKKIVVTSEFMQHLRFKYAGDKIVAFPDSICEFMGVEVVKNNSISNPFYELVF